MLQINRPQPPSFGESNDPASLTFRETLDFALAFLRRRWLIITTCLTFSFVLAASYLFTTPKSYLASSVMMIDTRRQILPQPLTGEISADAAWIDSQIGLLKSESVASYIVKQLQLA